MAHEWASREKTLRSYELWARHVAPHFQESLTSVQYSQQWTWEHRYDRPSRQSRKQCWTTRSIEKRRSRSLGQPAAWLPLSRDFQRGFSLRRRSSRHWAGAGRLTLNSSPMSGWRRCSAATSAPFTTSAESRAKSFTTTCARSLSVATITGQGSIATIPPCWTSPDITGSCRGCAGPSGPGPRARSSALSVTCGKAFTLRWPASLGRRTQGRSGHRQRARRHLAARGGQCAGARHHRRNSACATGARARVSATARHTVARSNRAGTPQSCITDAARLSAFAGGV
jgi:hypothetical protein